MMKKSVKKASGGVVYSMDDFKPITGLESVKGFKLAIFGADKSGKTYFTLANEKRPMFIIDTEGNAKTISKQFSDEHRENISVLDVKITDDDGNVDLINARLRVEAAVKTVCEYANTHRDERGLIVIDSISEYWEWCSIWLEHQKDLVRTQSGKMVQTEWGRVNKPHAEVLAELKATGWDIIVTGKAQPVYGGGGQKLDYNDAKWQKGIPYWADLTGELIYDGDKTTFKVTSNRFGRYLGEVDEPSYDKVKDYISKKSGVKFD